MASRAETFRGRTGEIQPLNNQNVKDILDGEKRLGMRPSKKRLRAAKTNLFREDQPEVVAHQQDAISENGQVGTVLLDGRSEETVASVSDWYVRIVYQDGRLRDVKQRALLNGESVPSEWRQYEIRRVEGMPSPPANLAE